MFTLGYLVLTDHARAEVEPPLTGTSVLLKQSSELQVGGVVPFFSGWLANGHDTFSLKKLLRQGKKRYVVTVCTSTCKPCFRGLRELTNARDEFKKRDIGVVVYVADQEEKARELKARFELEWTHVVVDKFKSFTRKFAAGKDGTLELPRTFVFDNEGRIEMIIGQEGADYIGLLLGKKR